MAQDLIGSRFRLGVNPQDSASYIARICGQDAANPQHLVLEYYATSANAPTQDFQKARGTVTAAADAVINDRVIDIRGLARSTSFQFGSAFRSYVDGPGPLVAGQNPPQRIGLEVALQNAAAREVVFLSSDGFLGVSNALFSTTERPAAHVHILGEAGDVHMHIEKVSADADPPLFEGFKARGTVAARANVTNGDVVLRLAGFARSTTYLDNAKIEYAVDAAVVAGQAPASRIDFYTNVNNAVPAFRLRLNSAGYLLTGVGAAALATGAAIFPTDGHLITSDSGESPQHFYLVRASTANGPNLGYRRQRGSFAAPANVVAGDRIIRVTGAAYSGATGYWDTARIDSEVEGAVVDNQRPGSMLRFFTNLPNASVTERMQIDSAGNVGFNTGSFGASSQGVLGVGNRIAAPTGNPTAGGILYAESGAGKWRGSGGTTTTFGPADPHCPVCGSDFGIEFERPDDPDPSRRYLAICWQCLFDHIQATSPATPKPWARKAKPAPGANELPQVRKDSAAPVALDLPDVVEK